MPFYRKRPVVIEARRFTGDNAEELAAWCGARIGSIGGRPKLFIGTLEGVMRVNVSDMVIKGVQGEFYPCAADIFDQTYEEVK